MSVQTGAGEGAGFADAESRLGAQIEADVDALWRNAELILKVKEPQPDEVARPPATCSPICTCRRRIPTRGLMESGAPVSPRNDYRCPRWLPLLAPMSTVRGEWLFKPVPIAWKRLRAGGVVTACRVVPGKERIGGGVVGKLLALGLGAEVTILDKLIG